MQLPSGFLAEFGDKVEPGLISGEEVAQPVAGGVASHIGAETESVERQENEAAVAAARLAVVLDGLGDELELLEERLERRDVSLVNGGKHNLEEETLKDVVVRIEEEPRHKVLKGSERQEIETFSRRENHHLCEDLHEKQAIEGERLWYLVRRECNARRRCGGCDFDKVIWEISERGKGDEKKKRKEKKKT